MEILNATAVYVSVMISLLFLNIVYRNLKTYYSDQETIYITQENLIKQFKLDNYFSDKMKEYERIGAIDRFPKMKNPVYYFSSHVIVGIIVAIILGIVLSPAMSIVGFFIGYMLLDLYFESDNKVQNEEISRNIMRMYESMFVQLSGGQYIVNAVISTKRVITNKRLLKAVSNFEKDIKVYNRPVSEAIDTLERKFDNTDVLTFCIMVKQNEENGKAVDLLKDLLVQIKDAQNLAFEKRKEKMDIKLTIVMLIIFGTTIAYILYLFVNGILSDNILL